MKTKFKFFNELPKSKLIKIKGGFNDSQRQATKDAGPIKGLTVLNP